MKVKLVAVTIEQKNTALSMEAEIRCLLYVARHEHRIRALYERQEWKLMTFWVFRENCSFRLIRWEKSNQVNPNCVIFSSLSKIFFRFAFFSWISCCSQMYCITEKVLSRIFLVPGYYLLKSAGQAVNQNKLFSLCDTKHYQCPNSSFTNLCSV